MTKSEEIAMLRGAAWMRETIARRLSSHPTKLVYTQAGRVRDVPLPSAADVEFAADKWMDAEIRKEL